MKAQDLKNSILQLAIQGKLVPQDANDESAEVLYAKIHAEKQKLIKEGKIKKDKPLPPITDDEIPFEIPSTWKWVRLSEIGSFFSGKTPKNDELMMQGKVPYFKVSDMNTEGNEIYMKYASLFLNPQAKYQTFPQNSIIFPKNGGAVFTNKKRILVTESLVDLNTGGYTPSTHLFFPYIYYLFLSIDFRKMYKGTALPTVDTDKLVAKLFPLPPLAEQKRIVAKIEELEPLVKQYDKAETELSSLNENFPGQLKKSILQWAIQGRLVLQDTNDETADILYAKIQAEKQKLIKEGKIKKDKPLPPITDDEVPFSIPPSWKWVRLGDIGYTQTGTTPSTSNPKYFGNDIPFIKPADITNISIRYNNEALSFLGAEQSRIIKTNSILMVCIGGSIGKCFKNDRQVCCNQQINTITPLTVETDYLLYTLQSDYFFKTLWSKATGTATAIVNKSSWENIIVPLPPLAEQHRIVAKVTELMQYCEKLKS